MDYLQYLFLGLIIMVVALVMLDFIKQLFSKSLQSKSLHELSEMHNETESATIKSLIIEEMERRESSRKGRSC